jgi:hypothetical protein
LAGATGIRYRAAERAKVVAISQVTGWRGQGEIWGQRRAGVMLTGQVFVSHTSDMAQFPDGRSFVQAALDAAGRAGVAPVDMRYFAARDGQPADYCRRRVRECDIYVAVVGFRYGSMVPEESVSYTELEFQESGKAGLPRLMFLLADNAALPTTLADADRATVEGFRQRLRDAGLIPFAATHASSRPTGAEIRNRRETSCHPSAYSSAEPMAEGSWRARAARLPLGVGRPQVAHAVLPIGSRVGHRLGHVGTT